MTDHERQPRTDRQEFMATAGFALYADVNERLLAHLQTARLQPLHETTYRTFMPSLHNPAGIALLYTVNQLHQPIPYVGEDFYEESGISETDREQAASHAFHAGFADQSFTWPFSAGVANASVDVLVAHGTLTAEQKDALTLADWADVIGSAWFGHLMHQMAITRNGLYQGFGEGLHDFVEGSLDDIMHLRGIAVASPILEYHERTDPATGQPIPTVVLSKAALQDLREKLDEEPRGSVGCPVARLAVNLPEELVQTNPHAQALIERQTLRPISHNSANATIRFTQEATTISKTLTFIAGQLRQYEATFGTPRLVPHDSCGSIRHQKLPKVGTFAARQTYEESQ